MGAGNASGSNPNYYFAASNYGSGGHSSATNKIGTSAVQSGNGSA